MIRVTCPTCGKTLSASDEKAGQSGKCVCGERIRLPGQIATKLLPPTPTRPVSLSTARAKAPSVAKANSKLVWFIVPLVGIGGIAVGVVVVLLLMNGNKGREEAKISNETPVTEQQTPAQQPSPQQAPAQQPPAVDPDQERILACVNGWLEAQKQGDMGAFYWDNFDLMTSLFAVRSWDILLDKAPHPITVFDSTRERKPAALIKVRIDSSTRGGMAVSNIWTLFMLRTGTDWKIHSMSSQGDD